MEFFVEEDAKLIKNLVLLTSFGNKILIISQFIQVKPDGQEYLDGSIWMKRLMK